MQKDAVQEKCEFQVEDVKDPISDCIGEYGRWQFIHTFFLSLFSFSCTFNVFSATFTAASREFWCARPNHLSSLSVIEWKNYSRSYDSCNILNISWSSVNVTSIGNVDFGSEEAIYIPCSSWEWNNSTFESTVISEWALVCDRAFIATLTEMTYLVGIAIGGVVSGTFSDRYGRKTTLMVSLLGSNVAGICMYYCRFVELYIALKFIAGFTVVSTIITGFTLAVELIGGKWITIVGICNFYPLPFSYIIVSVISKVLPNWRCLQLSLTIPGLLLIGLWWILPESPRWLMSIGDLKKLKNILQKASTFNKRALPENFDKILETHVAIINAESGSRKPGILDLFNRKHLKITLISSFGWFVNTLIYYAIVLKIGTLGGDLHMTSILSGAVEIPALALSIPLLMKFGRRYPISICMLLTGTLYLTSIFFDDNLNLWIRISLAMVGKFTAGIVNAVFPLFTAELFPTLIRNLGLGFGQISAGLALVAIPYLWLLAEYSSQIPMGVVGIIGIAGGFSILLLPETNNKPLGSAVDTNKLTYVEPAPLQISGVASNECKLANS